MDHTDALNEYIVNVIEDYKDSITNGLSMERQNPALEYARMVGRLEATKDIKRFIFEHLKQLSQED